MKAVVFELLPALFELLVFGISSVGLALIGAYIERFALVTVEAGQPKLAAWAAVVGAVAFYFAYLLSTDKFGPKLSEVRRRLTDRSA
jgi:hypothetical protein